MHGASHTMNGQAGILNVLAGWQYASVSERLQLIDSYIWSHTASQL